MEPEPSLAIFLHGRDGQPHEMTFNEMEIISILVHFCKSQKIPVPKQSEKRLILAHGVLIMQMARQNKSVSPPPSLLSPFSSPLSFSPVEEKGEGLQSDS
jgi:hypothetical protein